MSKETEYRIEHDSIGEKQIPKDAYYGVQTLRAAENLFITSPKMHPEFINSFTRIKKAAAITNFKVGRLDKERADAIVQACDGIMSGKLHDEFIVDPIQGDAGTSLSMNISEAVASRTIGILGGEKGDHSMVNPNDHVDHEQSTNDVFPSCRKLTALKLLYKAQIELEQLYYVLMEKSEEFDHIIRAGQTQPQDTVPVRLGQEFHTYATAIRRDINRFDRIREEMRHLSLGGITIGIGLNADIRYLQRVIKNISLISGLELIQTYDLIDATQDLDDYVACSGIVKSYTVNLSKMCNDLELMSSGPRTGLGKINPPTKQSGSSTMPGKVNPVIPEVVNRIAFHVIGSDMTVTIVAEAGQLELNAFESIIFHKLFQSVETTACTVHTLVDNCISGITVSGQHCEDIMENSVGIVTAIYPYVGYEKATDVAKEAIRTDESVRKLVIRDKLLTREQLGIILNPVSMTEPGISEIKAMNKMEGL